MATRPQRQHLLGLMDYLLAREPQVHYRQRRPMTTAKLDERALVEILDAHGTIAMDCSEAVTLLCRLAGLRDPNGRSYDGSGYTGTMLATLEHYTDSANAAAGALCVYGPATGEHVSMVHTPGKDPLMWSHGSEGGPRLVKLSLERSWHKLPVTFLSIEPL